MSTDFRVLVSKLNPTCKRAFDMATDLCVAQTNYSVEVEHVLLRLVDLPDTDVARVLRHYGVDSGELARQLTTAIEKFERGNSRTPAMSPQLLRLLREAWLQSTLWLESPSIRSAAMLLAIYFDDMQAEVLESCPILARVSPEPLREEIRDLIRESSEER